MVVGPLVAEDGADIYGAVDTLFNIVVADGAFGY